MSKDGLVYIGKIMAMEPIEDAHFIVSATVVCGEGGKWRGIVRKSEFKVGDLCTVYLPDAIVPETESMQFMKASSWRVKMRRFKGAPSEVLIMPLTVQLPIGTDCTLHFGVIKYHKPVPVHLQGIVRGNFPDFIPKTDEPCYQRNYKLVEALEGKPYYVTEKCDGSSTTAYRYMDKFGVCSRNLDLEMSDSNGYWQVALNHGLQEKLPEGIALQWETCGPGIQGNPMGLKNIEGFAFSGYDIRKRCYLPMIELWSLLDALRFPSCRVLDIGISFNADRVQQLGEGFYSNGAPREGVVVRSQENCGEAPISFKVINLSYDK